MASRLIRALRLILILQWRAYFPHVYLGMAIATLVAFRFAVPEASFALGQTAMSVPVGQLPNLALRSRCSWEEANPQSIRPRSASQIGPGLACRSQVPWPTMRRQLSKKEEPMMKHEFVRSGVTFGTALSIAISWSVNKSVLWAMLHGLFSWLYVIYYVIVR